MEFIIDSPAGVDGHIDFSDESSLQDLINNPYWLQDLANNVLLWKKTFWKESEAGVDWTEGRNENECFAVMLEAREKTGFLFDEETEKKLDEYEHNNEVKQ